MLCNNRVQGNSICSEAKEEEQFMIFLGPSFVSMTFSMERTYFSIICYFFSICKHWGLCPK